MDKDRIRMRIRMLLLLLLVGNGSFLYVFKSREPSLLERATRVEDTAQGDKDNPRNGDQVAAGRHLIAVTPKAGPLLNTVVDRVVIHEFEVEKESHLLNKYTIPLPFTAAFLDRQFSPEGDRIVLVLVQGDGHPSIFLWMHRQFPRYVPYPAFQISFWISRIDGSEMHELGYLPLHFPEGSDTMGADFKTQEPDHIEWLPDGKRLSFHYKDALYTVPAD